MINGIAIDYYYVYAYGGSPYQSLYQYLYTDGNYSFDETNPGSWSLYAYAYDYLDDGS